MKEKPSACGKFLIRVGSSIYTYRAGKMDIRIKKESTWGGREKDGKLYFDFI